MCNCGKNKKARSYSVEETPQMLIVKKDAGERTHAGELKALRQTHRPVPEQNPGNYCPHCHAFLQTYAFTQVRLCLNCESAFDDFLHITLDPLRVNVTRNQIPFEEGLELLANVYDPHTIDVTNAHDMNALNGLLETTYQPLTIVQEFLLPAPE